MIHDQKLILLVLTVFVSVVSLISSAINIILINSLGKNNYFLRILWNMCVCQMCYDATFYFRQCAYIDVYVYSLAELFNAFGGLSVSFWTNVLTYIMMLIIFRRQPAELVEDFWLHFTLVIGVSSVVGIAGMISVLEHDKVSLYIVEYTYYTLRLISIAINIIGFYGICYRVEQIIRNGKTNMDISIIVLSKRLMYYPLIQFFTRIVTAVYEAEYGFDQYSGASPTGQFIMQCCICICWGWIFSCVFIISTESI